MQDCDDVWGGSAEIDKSGNCVGGSTRFEPCQQDCKGDWGGNTILDNCGICDNNPANDCIQDCTNKWGGTAKVDNCDICVNGNTGKSPCLQDCSGIWGGSAGVDKCNICDNNPGNNCVQDCNGDWGGTAKIDNCNNCTGGSTEVEPCQPLSQDDGLPPNFVYLEPIEYFFSRDPITLEIIVTDIISVDKSIPSLTFKVIL